MTAMTSRWEAASVERGRLEILRSTESHFTQARGARTPLLLSAAIAAAILAGSNRPALAQEAAVPAKPEPSAKDSSPAVLEEVVVTATGTNIQGVKPVGSETLTLDRDDILSTGMTNPADVVNTLPQFQNIGSNREGGTAGYGGNPTQGTALNLRGIGTAATLTLVDGHRLAPSGTATTFTDAIQVPIAAIQRIEVVTDGNSAIYGSDAISGVVNYVLRKDFEGVEVGARNTSTHGYDEWGVFATAGHAWSHLGPLEGGNVILSIDHDQRGAMFEGKTPYLRENLTAVGGPDYRLNGNNATSGIPGNLYVQSNSGPVTTYSFYGLPAGPNTHLTFANLNPTPNLVDQADYTDYLGHLRRDQVTLLANQDINSSLSLYYEGFLTDRHSISRSLATNRTNAVTVPSTSPYYISGVPGVAPGAPENVTYNFFKDFGYVYTDNPDRTWSQTLGLKGKLGAGWSLDAYLTNGEDRACGICQYGTSVNYTAFQDQVNQGNINPFSSTALTPGQVATFTGNNIQESQNYIDDAVLRLNGPLFALPAGKVRLAVGAEYLYDKEHLENGANRGTDNTFRWDNITLSTREVRSGFAELYVPVIGSEQGVPLARSVSIDGAVRYDRYSDFGGTTNPKVGLTWEMNDELSLRGSWGTSFRAPALTDTNPGVFSVVAVFPTANNSGDPNIKNTFPGFTTQLFLFGANPRLQPETATTWSAGLDLEPHWLKGLKLSATYYDIRYTNQIVFSPPTGLFLSSPANRQLYSQYITPINNTGCVEGNPSTYDPKLQSFLAYPAVYGSSAGAVCSVQVVVDGREANLATTIQQGLDLQANYLFDTSFGHWALNTSITRVLKDEVAPAPGAGLQNVLDTITYPISMRSRSSVAWALGGWNATVFLNYVGSYENNMTGLVGNGASVPTQRVASWTTLDMTLAYEFDKEGRWAALGGLVAALNVQNLADRTPPAAVSLQGGNYRGMDVNNANPFGRIVQVSLTKRF
jgi:iron complex outermembrane recepter protein